MASAMRTAALAAPRRFGIVSRPLPVPGPGEVLVRTAATAVCHTDLGIYTGEHPGMKYPVVLGHESTGTVETAGDGVSGLAPGQPVIINPIISCGHCDSCKRGAQHLCRNAGLFGREVDGSLSEFVCLPSRYIHPLPPRLPLADATLIETLATVRHAQQRLNITAADSVVVLGMGTTGLLHAQLAALAGAAPVIVVSRSQWKLDLALRSGATHAIAAGAEQAVAEVLRLTGGDGAAVVIDTVGGDATLKAGIDMLQPGGRFSPYAVSHACCPTFSTFPLYYKEISIIGSRALMPSDMEPSIALAASGDIDISGFVSATYPLSRTAEAFEEYERNPGRILRIVIDGREG